MERYQLACQVLPMALRKLALSLTPEEMTVAEEIRLRVGQPMEVLLPQGVVILASAVKQTDLENLCNQATDFSRYGAVETLRQGYVSVAGGFRIGFCGTGVVRDGEICNLKNFSSAVVRIARERKGIGTMICPQLVDSGRAYSTLILSPPGGGKTTLLRDIVREFSYGFHGMPPQRVMLVDERGEVAGTHLGVPQLDVGSHTDVLDGCPKDQGMVMGLRTMNPQILAVDEITKSSDLQAMIQASHCGVSLLATLHGGSVSDLSKKPLYRKVLESGVFQRLVVISSGVSGREYMVEVLG